jgi:hypothetical protein
MIRKQLESFFHDGLLQNIRDVEIMLKLDGKSRFDDVSHPTYNEYCNLVNYLCDTTMQDLSPNWRNEYYATELDKVLATFVELRNQQCRANVTDDPSELCVEIPAPGRLASQFCESSISPSSGTTIFTPGPSPLESVALSYPGSPMSGDKIARWTPVSSPLPSPVELPVSSSTDPTQRSWELPQASLPSAPSRNGEVSPMRCELCNKYFKGNLQNQRRNLKRHRETCHDRNPKHSCQEPNCDRTFVRSDYLLKHRRGSHHLSDQPARQGSKTKTTNEGRLHQRPNDATHGGIHQTHVD